MQNDLAPIVLFVYNRPWHTKQTLDALMQNELADQSVLYIFADGAKENATDDQLNKIKEVRQVIRARKWCKEVHIIESDLNKGLANSVISGVTKIVNEYEKIIVLEDDLITSKKFLCYMNEALSLFYNYEKVMQVTGFFFPINIRHTNSAFFITFISSWGWGTWKRAWQYFDPNAFGYEELKKNKVLSKRFNLNGAFPYTDMIQDQMDFKSVDSWAIRWWWTVFQKEGVTLFPDKTFIENIGYGIEGTHTKAENVYATGDLDNQYYIKNFPISDNPDNFYTSQMQKYLSSKHGINKLARSNNFLNIAKKIRHRLSGNRLIFKKKGIVE
jgi:GT2 family glycosyltransferase